MNYTEIGDFVKFLRDDEIEEDELQKACDDVYFLFL